MDPLADDHRLLRGGPQLQQMAALLEPAGEQLLVAEGLAMAHLRHQVAVGGRRQAEMLGPQASGEALPTRVALSSSRSPASSSRWPATSSWPGATTRTGNRFIGGLPMNWATNRLAGH